MKLQEFTKPIQDMSKEELENYILNSIESIRDDFREAEHEAKNEQSRTRDQITAQ